MFSKLALFIAAAFAASAVAGPITDSCNTGPVQCCDSLNAPNSSSVADVLGLLGVVVGSLTGQVGLQCTPITGIGAGVGANCASTPVCCDKTFDNQLVGINCTPITINA
ncbi:fungal hydrophobin-domain-containing protein [Gymnopilus junonius]|uniref:Hydrophobin n=1 Tax=Gymnopilus junonius TaxID=109634 RepID=A0A9P5TJI0_GYMJU|nr:fungal hydrophobin-domain-containing protein [Gymnopilus junonius]